MILCFSFVKCFLCFSCAVCDWIDSIRVGVEIPTIEVRFENLNIEAEAFVGSRALPSFINFNRSMVEVKNTVIYLLVIVFPCSCYIVIHVVMFGFCSLSSIGILKHFPFTSE